jgi:hypothetical protein
VRGFRDWGLEEREENRLGKEIWGARLEEGKAKAVSGNGRILLGRCGVPESAVGLGLNLVIGPIL